MHDTMSSEAARREAAREAARSGAARSAAVLGVLSLALSVALGAPGLVAPARADEEPLRLTNEHIGMSAEEIADSQGMASGPSAEEAPIVLREPEEPAEPIWITARGEFLSDESGAAAEEASSAGAATALSSFGECIERSVRSGVGFDESAPVCRALFPGPR